MKRLQKIMIPITVIWLLGTSGYAYIYINGHVDGRGTVGYETEWSFQLVMFCLVRLPFLVIGLLSILCVVYKHLSMAERGPITDYHSDLRRKDSVNKSEKSEIGKIEKVTRFGCGALLGFFIGLYFIAKWIILSFGVAIGIWAVAILLCGYLALKYGDEFWYGMFGRNK